MSVPEAIKRQEEEAQKLYEESYKEEETPEEQAGEESSASEETPVETPQALEEEEVGGEEQEQTPDYQEQYFTLKGKYEAEVPRLIQEVQSLREHINQMNVPPERLDDEGGDEEDPISRLSNDYGEGFVDDLRTLFRTEFSQQVEPLATQVKQTAEMSLSSHREKYFASLTELVPDWQNVVRDPRFATYVQERDGFSGMPRLSLMQHAESQMDANRMANFYNDFKRRVGALPSKGSQSKKMAALTPGQTSNKTQTGAGKGEPDYVKAEELQEFATQVALRKFEGREDEMKKIEARHDRARANGWII